MTVYSQNFDFSSFPCLVERLYFEMKMIDYHIGRQMPYCAFQHVCTSILNAALITVIQDINGEDRFKDDRRAQTRCQMMKLPQAIIDYISCITSTITSDGKKVHVNIPNIAVPKTYIPATEDSPAIENGTFGVVNAETHNVYECYISPYVTRKYLEACKAKNNNWSPLPEGYVEQDFRPTTNLLGYGEIEVLHEDAMNCLRNLDFPSERSTSFDARIQYSSVLTANVTAYLNQLSDRMKMGTLGTERRTVAGNIAFVEVNEPVEGTGNLSCMSPTIYSSEPIDSNIANISYLYGFKRKRNPTASGPCYVTATGDVPDNWIDHCNDNFLMVGHFQPAYGINDAKLQVGAHLRIHPAECRDIEMSRYLRSVYRLKK